MPSQGKAPQTTVEGQRGKEMGRGLPQRAFGEGSWSLFFNSVLLDTEFCEGALTLNTIRGFVIIRVKLT